MVIKQSLMKGSNLFGMALSCHSFVGQYESPETKTVNLRCEGVLCSSVFNQHQEFTFDTAEDL